MKPKKAFTLIELLVVIAIIGILATVSIISLSNARAKSRDAKRAGDMKQVQTALELFFNDKGRYPTATEWNTNQIYSTSTTGTSTYMQIIPSAPTPVDGSCTTDQNTFSYAQTDGGNSYTISLCLGNTTGTLDSGPKCLTPGGIVDVDCTPAPAFTCGDTVSYESGSYPTVQIGSQCWLAKNLNIGTRINGAGIEPDCHEIPAGWGTWSCQGAVGVQKFCLNDNESNCTTYGGLYEWAETMGFSYLCNNADFSSGSSSCGTGETYIISSPHQGICPTGWHIPTDAEWHTLELGLADPSDETNCDGTLMEGATCAPAGIKLRSSATDSPPWMGDNSSGFKALPSGVRQTDGTFYGAGDYTVLWSVSLGTANYNSLSRTHYSAQWEVYRGVSWRDNGQSVRCLKD